MLKSPFIFLWRLGRGVMSDNKKLTICKSNRVVEASYKLTLNEQRVVLACIAQVNSKEELLATDKFELSAKDFAKLFSVSDDAAYLALRDVAESLFNRYVVIENPFPADPSVTRLKTRWISSIYYKETVGKIVLCFAQDMLPYLGELKGHFTRYNIEHIGKMTSVYGIRLYELLAQWQSVGKRETELDWLKKQFEIEDKYAAIKDLKKYVIDPAVKDINTHSNYQVGWTQRKTGRKVTHLTFEFSEKQPIVPLKKTRAKLIKQPTTEAKEVKIDNLEYFASVRKKYGDAAKDAIPKNIVEQLKAQGRW
jgi:plasmid replication initiation protein